VGKQLADFHLTGDAPYIHGMMAEEKRRNRDIGGNVSN